ncbi:hypothetical protein [Accumulibacter sp.]|uniref:hypothetical protein n=1 Tax=Accumulibacter sp. TaxID=2053492 RepID=UPI002588032B|nr:hypothetical protein [Accumulibacter sp.]
MKIAARHLHRRGGVMIGDVVGLGKTMMATALARMFEDDLGYETLIICPKTWNRCGNATALNTACAEKANIGIRPERHMRKHGISEPEFERRHQCKANSILAIEKSEEFDDWRELIRLYMVRRTRSFIIEHYTAEDDNGRRYIADNDGEKRYFPKRMPISLKFAVDEADPDDRYARLYSAEMVDQINALHVPRYGMGLYVDPLAEKTATAAERKLIDNLGRAGKRLMGFCRTNLFKRLESNGFSFLQSIDRHILRNQIYLYAIETRWTCR